MRSVYRYRYDCESEIKLTADSSSFNHILIIEGSGTINSREFRKGDSFSSPQISENIQLKEMPRSFLQKSKNKIKE